MHHSTFDILYRRDIGQVHGYLAAAVNPSHRTQFVVVVLHIEFVGLVGQWNFALVVHELDLEIEPVGNRTCRLLIAFQILGQVFCAVVAPHVGRCPGVVDFYRFGLYATANSVGLIGVCGVVILDLLCPHLFVCHPPEWALLTHLSELCGTLAVRSALEAVDLIAHQRFILVKRRVCGI